MHVFVTSSVLSCIHPIDIEDHFNPGLVVCEAVWSQRNQFTSLFLVQHKRRGFLGGVLLVHVKLICAVMFVSQHLRSQNDQADMRRVQMKRSVSQVWKKIFVLHRAASGRERMIPRQKKHACEQDDFPLQTKICIEIK